MSGGPIMRVTSTGKVSAHPMKGDWKADLEAEKKKQCRCALCNK